MPFTPAHSAIVLPLLRRKYLSDTALIVGSVAPDFEYFIRMSVHGEYSHTLGGLFWFDLPLTFLLSALFHQVVKRNLIHHLPAFFQLRFQDTFQFEFWPWVKRNYAVFAFSALLGSASHIVWDNFTHADGYFVSRLWFYKGTVVPLDGARYPLFYALQHISTFVGLFMVMMYIIFKRPSDHSHLQSGGFFYWILLILIAGLVYWIRFTVNSSDMQLGNLIVVSISGLCIALVVCGLVPFGKSKV